MLLKKITSYFENKHLEQSPDNPAHYIWKFGFGSKYLVVNPNMLKTIKTLNFTIIILEYLFIITVTLYAFSVIEAWAFDSLLLASIFFFEFKQDWITKNLKKIQPSILEKHIKLSVLFFLVSSLWLISWVFELYHAQGLRDILDILLLPIFLSAYCIFATGRILLRHLRIGTP